MYSYVSSVTVGRASDSTTTMTKIFHRRVGRLVDFYQVCFSVLHCAKYMYMITAAHCGIIFSRKNIIDSPVCKCGEVENTSYSFLHNNLSGQPRHALLNRVSTFCQPTVNIFVHGSNDLSVNEIAELFSGAILYTKIKKFLHRGMTKRTCVQI